MANEVTVTTADVRPLTGAITRRAKASAAIAFGDVVYISSYSGDKPIVTKCDGTDLGKALAFGIAVAPQSDTDGATSIATSDWCDVVTEGPVTGYSGMTSGAHIWVSDTVGRLSTVAGTKSCIVGVAESPTVVYVRIGEFTAST